MTDYDAGAIALAAPYQVRSVTLDIGDPEIHSGLGVRAVTVRIYDATGDKMLVNETLRPHREPASMIVEFLQDAGSNEYTSEITWQQRGGTETTTGLVQTGANILFLDELPSE